MLSSKKLKKMKKMEGHIITYAPKLEDDSPHFKEINRIINRHLKLEYRLRKIKKILYHF